MIILGLSLVMVLVQGDMICTNPKGHAGDSYTEGCLKMTCKTGVWRSSLETSLCCYKRQPYLPNTTITATNDGCATAVLYCKQEDDVATAVLQVEDSCGNYSTEEQVQELEHLLVKHMEQTDSDKNCPASTSTTSTTTNPKQGTEDSDKNSPASTSTTSTTTNPKQGKEVVGIMIAGGYGARTSTEIFLPGSGRSCGLADLPDQRHGHTLDTVSNTAVLCGGGDHSGYTQTSCLQFSQDTGTWSSYATRLKHRYSHSSWVTTEETLVLMGGILDPTTTEIVKSGMNFTMAQDTRYACSIQLGSYTIITGGADTQTAVSKYNIQGHVEDLPSMMDGRYSHACGSFQYGGHTVLVVAGGRVIDERGFNYKLATTERHTLGVDSAWTAGQALPRVLTSLACVSLDHAVIILGGSDNRVRSRSEVLSYNGEEWTELGHLGVSRSKAAATKILVDPAVCG